MDSNETKNTDSAVKTPAHFAGSNAGKRASHDQKPSREAKRHHHFHPHVILTVCAVVVALVAGLAIGNGGFVHPGESHVDSTTIKNSFADVAELATQEYDFSNVGKFSQDDMKILDLSIPFTGRSFLVTYSGDVKAGIDDISKASVDVDDGAQTITVTLPQVKVLESHIDSNSVKTYDQTLNPINQISVDDVTSFLASEEDARRDEAVNGGILDKARSRAESLITTNIRSLLNNTTEKDYQVNIVWQDDNSDTITSSSDTSNDSSSADSPNSDSATNDGGRSDASASNGNTSNADAAASNN